MVSSLFVGCEDDTANEIDSSSIIKGSVHGIVKDESSNSRIDSVSVFWSHGGEMRSTLTDSMGYYSITDLSTGSYEITFHKDGIYATGTINVDIPTLQDVGLGGDFIIDQDYHYSETKNMDLYGLTSGLTGLVYKTVDAENTSLAVGATVIADFSNYDITPHEYTVSTDANGRYDFSNLPATSSVFVRVLPFNDGSYDFDTYVSLESLIPNQTTDGDLFLNLAEDNPFILQNNFENNDFSLNSDIVLTFSKTMDENTLDINLYSYSYGNVELLSSLSNGITLSIDPLVSLQANTTYFQEISGQSVDNNSLNISRSFQTITGIEFVSSNLEFVDGNFDEFPRSSNIELLFSMDIDTNQGGYGILSQYILDTTYSYYYDWYPVTGNATVSNNKLVFNSADSLRPNTAHKFDWKIYSAIYEDYDIGSIDFNTGVE
jgi:hypothetical protein